MSTVTDVLGHDTVFEYDDDGRMTRVTDVLGHQTHIQYDENNFVASIADENGRITRNEYDEWKNLTKVIYPDGATVEYEYEHTFNRKIKETDERGNVTQYQYDDQGNLIQKIEAAGTSDERTTEYTYDDQCNVLTVKKLGDNDTLEALTTMTYDEYGNLTSTTDPEDNTTFFTHDIMGNVLTKTDARGKVWAYEYDAAGRMTKVIDPLSFYKEMFYDEAGNKIKEIDEEGKEKRFEYDIHNNLVKIIDHKTYETRFEYNSDNKLIQQIDPEGKVMNYVYDSEGRLIKTVDGNGNDTDMAYENGSTGTGCATCSGTGGLNQPSVITYPTFSKQFEYDTRNRKVKEMDVLSDTESYITEFGYDLSGNLAMKIDKQGKTTNYTYDGLNRLASVTDALDGTTTYTYDSRDNLIALTDANHQTTQFEYDKNNRLVKEIRPMGEETSYSYDEAGNLISKIDAKNQKTGYVYDDAGRLSTIKYYTAADHTTPVKTVFFTYDTVGNITGYDDGTTSAVYVYDDLHRKIVETVDFGPFSKTFHYEHYHNGLKKRFVMPDNTGYDYTYDDANQLVGVQIPNVGAITVTSYNWNRPDSISLPGGSKQEYSYDPLMRVKSIADKDPAQNIFMQYSYTYDMMDNITAKSTWQGVQNYTYDDLYRLTASDHPIDADESFTYDAVGNRLTSSDTSDTWSYNLNNELQGFDTVWYDYDAKGNMIQKSDGGVVTKFFYNLEDRLERVENVVGTVIAVYYYDPFGRRLWKEVSGVRTYFLCSDEGLIGEYDNSGNEIKAYGYKPGSTWTTDPLFMKIGSEYYFYQNDHLGTPQKLIAINGAVAWDAKYTSFLKANVDSASTIENNLRAPGQYFDQETGLHYNWHRYYDTMVGRYFRTDPIGLNGGMNLFVYVYNNPTDYIDPDGQIAWAALLPCVKGALTSAVVDVAVQECKCCWKQYGWEIWKCKLGECPPINKCSVAVSAVVGCAAGYIPGAPPTTLEGLKIILRKMGASSILKFLGKLGC